MQTGTQVLGELLERHAYHRCRAGVNLETTGTTALALHTTKRFYADVTKFTGRAISAAPTTPAASSKP